MSRNTKQPITQEMKSFLDDFNALLKKHGATFDVEGYGSVSFYIKDEEIDIQSENSIETVEFSCQPDPEAIYKYRTSAIINDAL